MALPLSGSNLICLAAPSESQFGELYLISLTCGMVFLKACALAHFSLQSSKSNSDDSKLNISFSPRAHSAKADADASIEHLNYRTIGHSVIAPRAPVRNLGVWLDSNLSYNENKLYSILLFVQYQEDKEIS